MSARGLLTSLGRRLSWARLSAVAGGVLALTAATTPSRSAGADLSVRITSPLGRTGGIGTVRIVAQIQQPPGATLNPVRFYVDGTLFKTDDDGPPYAVEWTDENPFERRELSVEVDDSEGRKGRDKIVLEAFEITEISEVASVLLEAGVYDRTGRFVSGLSSRASSSRKTACRRLSTSSATSACPPRLRCSSTAARACRGDSTS